MSPWFHSVNMCITGKQIYLNPKVINVTVRFSPEERSPFTNAWVTFPAPINPTVVMMLLLQVPPD